MKILTKLTSWPCDLHRASISSFGFGAATAHAILESIDSFLPGYNLARKERAKSNTSNSYILPFSGSTIQSLEARILDLAKRFSGGEMYDFGDPCHRLANRRSKLSKKSLLLTSEATARTDFAIDKLITAKQKIPLLELGFVFTGPGRGMASDGPRTTGKVRFFRRNHGVSRQRPCRPSRSTILDHQSRSSRTSGHKQSRRRSILPTTMHSYPSWHRQASP